MNDECIHHWVIDASNVGHCKKCPAVRDFGALLKKQGADIVQARVQSAKRGRPSSAKRGRPSKRQLLVGAMIKDASTGEEW